MPDPTPNPDPAVLGPNAAYAGSLPEIDPNAPPPPNVAESVLGSGTVPNQPTPRVAQPALPGPPPPPARPARPSVAPVTKESFITHAAHALLGSVHQGNPNRPGKIWRDVLAGALLGAAAGTEAHNQNPNMGALGGAAVGGGAEIQDQRQQELERRKQAALQFQQQQQVAQGQREQERIDLEKENVKNNRMFLDAQVAHLKASTAQLVLDAQGTDLVNHAKLAEMGAAFLEPFKQVGAEIKASDVSFATMMRMHQNNPEANRWLWMPTSTFVEGVNDQRQPIYDTRYTAVDRDQPVPMTAGLQKVFDAAHVDYGPLLKPGRMLEPSQAIALYDQAIRSLNDQHKLAMNGLDEEAKRTRIDYERSERSKNLAEAGKLYREAQDGKEEKTKAAQYNAAVERFNKLRQDPNNAGLSNLDLARKLNPGDVTLISEGADRSMAYYSQALKALPKNDTGTGIADEYQGLAHTLAAGIEATAELKNIALGATTAGPGAGGQAPQAGAAGSGISLAPVNRDQFRTAGIGPTFMRGAQIGSLSQDESKKVLDQLDATPTAQGRQAIINALKVSDADKAKLRKAALTGAQAAPAKLVRVQAPGHPPGNIPEDKLDEFLNNNPGAVTLQ